MKKKITFEDEENRFLIDITEIAENPLAVDKFITENYDKYFVNLPNGEYKKYILGRVYKNYLCRDREEGHRLVQITEGDIAFLQSLPTDRIKRIFYSLKIRSKATPHQTGWIALVGTKALLYAFTKREVLKFKLEELSMCVPYGLDICVIGSSKPVLCFKIKNEFEDGKVVFEFEDGVAFEKFEEVIAYERNSD